MNPKNHEEEAEWGDELATFSFDEHIALLELYEETLSAYLYETNGSEEQ